LLLGAWLELAAARLHDVCLVATGEGWGPGVRSVDQAMLELVLAAKRSIHLTIFSVTGGADALLGAVATRMHEETSMECWCLFDAPEAGPLSWAAPPSLARLAQGYPDRFHLFAVSLPQGNLHAKVLVADRSRVVLGSANLTLAGLQRSHELGVILAGPVAWDLAQRIETLSCARFSWQRVGGKQPND
jgi:phosphatidylserine/phosphatidylglycerophosphate/cardiolipin synthase-like enzyme